MNRCGVNKTKDLLESACKLISRRCAQLNSYFRSVACNISEFNCFVFTTFTMDDFEGIFLFPFRNKPCLYRGSSCYDLWLMVCLYCGSSCYDLWLTVCLYCGSLCYDLWLMVCLYCGSSCYDLWLMVCLYCGSSCYDLWLMVCLYCGS